MRLQWEGTFAGIPWHLQKCFRILLFVFGVCLEGTVLREKKYACHSSH